MKKGRVLTGFLAVLLSIALLWSASALIFAKDGLKRITVVFTNDTLGNVVPCPT